MFDPILAMIVLSDPNEDEMVTFDHIPSTTFDDDGTIAADVNPAAPCTSVPPRLELATVGVNVTVERLRPQTTTV